MEQKTRPKPFEWIETLLPELGLSHFGMTELVTPLSFAHYETWLAQGHQAGMKYLTDHAEQKQNPQRTFAPALSAFVFAAPYLPHPEGPNPLPHSRVALYAQGYDYHFWLKSRLQKIVERLELLYPEESFLVLTDSSPIMERDLASQASLGWFGKNTCLIHPKKGSLFLIGEILSSLKIKSEAEPLPDFCGTCQRCMEVCPTQALIAPQKLDANKCISYWTIEAREVAPVTMREKIGDWLFGCDLCQTVCPWNQKLFKNQLAIEPLLTLDLDQSHLLMEELRWLLVTSGKQIQKRLAGTPLLRAGPRNLKRNAMIVIANRKIKGLENEIRAFLDHAELRELAEWTLAKLAQI